MERIESNSLFVSTLKEKLHAFHLPNLPVITEETKPDYEGRVYIKDNWVVKASEGKFRKLFEYSYNKQTLNLTRNLILNSSTYDEYTHQYLGDYLRFQRDYNHYNLMSMYNCFYGTKPSRIYRVFKWDEEVESNVIKQTVTLNTDDSRYNYYIVPVKLDQVYTIAIDSTVSYELMCILYNGMFIEDTPVQLFAETYQKVPGSTFKQPYIFSLKNLSDAKTIWPHEKDLRLVIKLPKLVKSSIVVLEGNYSICAETFHNMFMPSCIYNEAKLPDTYASKLELLSINDKQIHLLAPRLLEYILGMPIDSQDWISQNISRLRDKLYYYDNAYGIWTDKLRYKLYSLSTVKDVTRNNTRRFIDNYFDITGFVDKDLEYLLEVLK